MARKLINVKSGGKYRHYCSECGAFAGTTDLPVWPSRQAFCSKKCESSYFSLKNFGLMLAFLIGHALAFLAPWIAFVWVNDAFGFTGIGSIAVRFAAAFLAGAAISFPIYKLLHRWTK